VADETGSPVWSGVYSLGNWRERAGLAAAADTVVTGVVNNGAARRLLADACVRRADALVARDVAGLLPNDQDGLDEETWEYWSLAVDYLEAAGVLDEAQNEVADQLLGRRPWCGSLDELVVVLREIRRN